VARSIQRFPRTSNNGRSPLAELGFRSAPFLRLFAVFDVGSCRMPAKDMAMFISESVVTDEETTVLAIFAACPLWSSVGS
jgi:hypothetical protein